MRRAALPALLCALAIACAQEPQRVLLGTTHTLEDSGLLDSITTAFASAHPEIRLQIVVAGSGEILEMGRRGDVDVLLTHAPDDERKFVADGYGTDYHAVAHNEFLIAAPPGDAARAGNAASAADAFRRIVATGQLFVSRGDDSGTNRKELAIWKLAAVRPDSAHYIRAGTGMADALRLADERRAYILTDLATFLTLHATLTLRNTFHGDPVMRNSYSVMVVSKARNAKGARTFDQWITGADAQHMIGRYGVRRFGRPLFTPDASK